MDLLIHYYPQAKSFIKEDITSLIGEKTIDLFDNFCIIKDISIKESAKLSFLLQAAIHIGVYLGKSSFESNFSESFKGLEKSIDFDSLKLLSNNISTFAIDSIKLVDIAIPTPDISAKIADFISKFLDKGVNVNLRNPDFKVNALVLEKELVLFVDLIGFLLSKRPYKITAHAGSLNGVFAYTISRLTGYEKGKLVVDPFCGGGPIPIECALFNNEKSAFTFENKFKAFNMTLFKDEFEKLSDELNNKEVKNNKKVFGFDYLLKALKNSQKNAKLSGVFEALNLSKVDVEWIDAKFNEGEVDFIISNPPQISKRTSNKKHILKVYDDLFFQAKYLLSKNGFLGLLLKNKGDIVEIASRHKVKLIEEIPISTGGQKYTLLKFKKN